MNLSRVSILFIVLGWLCYTSAWSDQVNYMVVEEISRPFQITDNSNSKGGIVSDLVDEIFKDSNYTLKYHVLPLKRLYKMIESGEIKNWIAYDAKVWNALSEWGDFVDVPLFSVKHAYLTCQPGPPMQINSANDIRAHNVAIINGFDYPELTRLQKQGDIQLQTVKSYQQGINLAGLNRVDGFVEMELRLRYNMQKESLGKPCFQFIDMSRIIPTYSIYLSIDKRNNNGLNQFTEQRIKALKKAGTVDSVLRRYSNMNSSAF